jgi:hypothetical protein
MNFPPDIWTDDKKQEWADRISEVIVDDMSTKDLERYAFDAIADDLFNLDWPDVWEFAEGRAPDLIESALESGVTPWASPPA